MATSEPTPSPEEMLLPVSVKEFFKWDDLEQIHLCGLGDSSSDEDTTGRETSHTLDFQLDKSPGKPQEEPEEEPALMQQRGRTKWFSWRMLGQRREQYRVLSNSPTGKSKSLSSSQQSHKSEPGASPQSLEQKIACEVLREMFVRPSVINLTTITHQVDVPKEVADVSCHKVRLPIVYDIQYNISSAPNLVLPKEQKMLNAIPGFMYYQLQERRSRYKCVKWKAVDISSVYGISNYVSIHIKQCDVRETADVMKLSLSKPLPSWEVFSSVVLRPLRVQMMGSVVACKLALDEGWAINLGGGFGYHTTNINGGLAVYDDVLVCLAVMSNFKNVEHIGVINLDAYQAPSYQYAKNINCSVTIVDVYTRKIEEKVIITGDTRDDRNELVTGGTRNQRIDYRGFDASVDLKARTFDEYLDNVKRLIAVYFGKDQVKPSLCIYVRGTTVLDKNPRATLSFNRTDVATLDKAVFELITSHNIKIAVLLGGGYQWNHAQASAFSLRNLINWWTTLKGDLSTLKV